MKKDYIKNLHLHLFDGAPAGGTEGGAEGTASTQGSGAEPTVVYGKDPAADDSTSQVGSDEGGDDPDGNELKEDIDAEFEELIKGKYKQQFDGRVHSIMQNRFKNAQDAKDVAAKWQGATAALAAMYGIDGTDPDALKDAIEKDDGLFSAQAEAQGLTPEQFRENLRLRMDAQTGRNMQEQMRIEAEKQATFQRWESEAAELTETFPNFDLAYELENEAFLDGLNRGLSVRDAFFVAHMDEIVAGSNAAAKSEATQKVVDNFNQRAARPAENGASHKPAVIRKTDPSKFTDADLDEIARRSRRGETIRF
ncbi:MAG: hypothetical protein V8R50_01025 [Clostridia bacterium]